MVGAFGEVQVMDWGLAKVLAEGGVADEERAGRPQHVEGTQIRTARSTGSGVGTDTEAGSLLGTPAYMPPEQANGDVANLDRRADVFGLGAILCEILTGKPPYVGRFSEEVRRKACNGNLADALARLDACGADGELIALTKTCLAPEAIDRPKDAQAVADGLTAYLNGVQERLHQAELAEAEAKAKAVEEAKRRRLTLALAGTVLMALTLGGGGYLYVRNERDTRQAKVAREVNDALNQATALREQAKAANVGGAALFAQAREQVQRALALVESGPAENTLKTLVTRLQAELDEEEKDRKLLAALDEARLAQADSSSGRLHFAQDRAVPKFREAFRAYGLPAGENEPKLAAERIRQRPAAIRDAIIAALDEWDALAADKRFGISEPHAEWLRAVLEAAEPADGWTRQFRAARTEKDQAKRKNALEKLTAADDVGTLPVRSLTRLAWQLAQVEADATAARLLRRAQQQYPADFWVNFNLSWFLQKMTPPELDDAVRFLTAAVALRPESMEVHFILGYLLHGKGQVEEAIACYQKAIALDSKFALAHYSLAVLLGDKGQVDEAIACYRKAIELDPKLARAHLNLGNALMKKGQFDEAIATIRKAIEIDPKRADAHYNLGTALHQKGQLDEAIASLKKATELDPKLAKAHTNLGAALHAKGLFDEAVVCHKKAIALDSKDAKAHHNLGAALHAKGLFDEAVACFQKAIALDPNLAGAHLNLGVALHVKGQVEEAVACFHKAIALDPKFARAHTNLGAALQAKGQVDKAVACFQKAIALDSKDAMAHNNLGAALQAKGQVDAAIASYRKAIELDQKYAKAYNNLGGALKGKGQVDDAIACFRKAIAFDPKYATAHTNLGGALAEKGKLDEAVACLKKAIALDPKDAGAHTNLGRALLKKGQVDAAIACYRKAIELDPKLAAAHLNLGEALRRKGHVDEAIASFKKAIALDPKLAIAHYNLGVTLYGKRQVDETIACYRKAIDLDPKYTAAHNNLGVALYGKGQVDEAIVCWKKAIALDPKLAGAHAGLGVALHGKGQVDEAIVCYKKAIALAWNVAMVRTALANAERLAAARDKLPAFQNGSYTPANNDERLGLAEWCKIKKVHRTATGLYATAFAADPKLADDLRSAHRYNAACNAALAGAGQGEDAAKLDEKERTRLRQQALNWLRADLALRSKQMKSWWPREAGQARAALVHWQKDTDLAGLRDKDALAKLPAEVRAACAKLWADVAALLKKAGAPAKSEGKR
jgi:tetratricopeptide (TPR) repeat protein